MKSSTFGAALLLIAGLIVAFAGAFASWKEVGSYLNSENSEAGILGAIQSGRMAPALSQQSGQAIAIDCLQTAKSLYLKFRPKPEKRAFDDTCQSIVGRLVTEMPTFSFGWAVMAYFAGELQNWEALNLGLRVSQETGRSEQWIAEIRVEIAEDNFDRLTPQTVLGEAEDLGMLVLSRRGVASIAKRYVEDAKFRERITAIVEALPQDAQARFVVLVRSAAELSR